MANIPRYESRQSLTTANLPKTTANTQTEKMIADIGGKISQFGRQIDEIHKFNIMTENTVSLQNQLNRIKADASEEPDIDKKRELLSQVDSIVHEHVDKIPDMRLKAEFNRSGKFYAENVKSAIDADIRTTVIGRAKDSLELSGMKVIEDAKTGDQDITTNSLFAFRNDLVNAQKIGIITSADAEKKYLSAQKEAYKARIYAIAETNPELAIDEFESGEENGISTFLGHEEKQTIKNNLLKLKSNAEEEKEISERVTEMNVVGAAMDSLSNGTFTLADAGALTNRYPHLKKTIDRISDMSVDMNRVEGNLDSAAFMRRSSELMDIFKVKKGKLEPRTKTKDIKRAAEIHAGIVDDMLQGKFTREQWDDLNKTLSRLTESPDFIKNYSAVGLAFDDIREFSSSLSRELAINNPEYDKTGSSIASELSPVLFRNIQQGQSMDDILLGLSRAKKSLVDKYKPQVWGNRLSRDIDSGKEMFQDEDGYWYLVESWSGVKPIYKKEINTNEQNR